MSVMRIMRQIQDELGNDAVIKVEIGNYKEPSSLDRIGDDTVRLNIIKDDVFIPFLIEECEFDESGEYPGKLVNYIMQKVNEATRNAQGDNVTKENSQVSAEVKR